MNRPTGLAAGPRLLGLAAALLVSCTLAGGTAMRPGPAPSEEAPASGTQEVSAPASPGGVVVRRLSSAFYDPTAFALSVQDARPYPLGDTPGGTLAAGVVPHHLLAGRMIASFFAAAAQEEYDTVVFVAPQHYPTPARIVTTERGWNTPFGALENDTALTALLTGTASVGARVDDENMQLDHAVTGLVPYVKYYLPGAKVSAVLLQNGLEDARVRALAELLREAAKGDKKLLLVASIDFSHYLMPREAAARDQETRAAVESFDFEALGRFHDSNVDSPESLSVFLRFLLDAGLQPHILDHSSSDRIMELSLRDPAFREGTTTYFILGGILPPQEPALSE